MSKIHDPLSVASAEMLTATASQVHELVQSVRKLSFVRSMSLIDI